MTKEGKIVNTKIADIQTLIMQYTDGIITQYELFSAIEKECTDPVIMAVERFEKARDQAHREFMAELERIGQTNPIDT